MSTDPSPYNHGTWGNAFLTFKVSGLATVEDPETGNPVPLEEELCYQAALKMQGPNWKGQEGVDMTTYNCQGRVLSPHVLDPRITNGSQAEAVINGYKGRFELVFDLQVDQASAAYVRQNIQGTFRVIGGLA